MKWKKAGWRFTAPKTSPMMGENDMDQYFRCFGLPGSFVLTVLMSLYALVLAVLHPSQARLLCLAAMLMSSVGDIFLMRFKGLDRIFPNYFVIGAAFFMAAHLLYMGCYALKIRQSGAPFWNGGVIAAAAIALACFVYFTGVCARRHDFSSYPLALAYLVVITLNCACIFSYSFSAFAAHPAAIAAAAGALSFLLSDLIIGLGMLAGINRYDDLIWWLYPVGQVLIITMAG